MASSRGIAVVVGKRIADQIWTRSALIASRRGGHSSAYDKNPDEQGQASQGVGDEVVDSNSDKYWAPDPRTGVFGPANGGPVSGEVAGHGSVLEQTAWFRPTSIEDLEKPASTNQ